MEIPNKLSMQLDNCKLIIEPGKHYFGILIRKEKLAEVILDYCIGVKLIDFLNKLVTKPESTSGTFYGENKDYILIGFDGFRFTYEILSKKSNMHLIFYLTLEEIEEIFTYLATNKKFFKTKSLQAKLLGETF